MDNIIYQDSPLAEFLEGEGRAEPEWAPASSGEHPAAGHTVATPNDFAPRGTSTLHSRLREKLPQPLKIPLHAHDPVGRIHSACSRAVNSRIGRADNERFLEHFRYLIVASHLLNDRSGQTGFRPPSLLFGSDGAVPTPIEYRAATTSVNGVLVICGVAFVLVWLINHARASWSNGRITAVIAALAILSVLAYIYMRRQWLLYLRQQAVDAASKMVINMQAFDASSSSALTFIQEVELISRGYRLSTPLPPITRLEERGQAKRCAKLRRCTRNAFAAVVPPFLDECETVRKLVEEEDFDKYLDIYDITTTDLQEAALGYSESEFEDADGLKALRIHQYRQGILRRAYLCSLLAMQADGGKSDIARWRTAIESMERLASITGIWSEKINDILNEEEQFTLQTPLKNNLSPDKEHLRAQVRKLTSLSQGIRGLQAKMQVLREESNRSLEHTEEAIEFGSALMSHYESIGSDLKALVKAWEDGKSSLAVNIDRAERRASQTSSGLRSPALSLGGLTVVDEGSPSDALRALNGEIPMNSYGSSSNNSDEEIFEAIAVPRQRPRMSPEERKAKIAEDRAKRESMRDQRDTATNMLRELESVIRLRPGKPPAGGRTTSI